jgi:hypothetical protein
MVDMRDPADTDGGPALDDKVPALANVPSKRALVSRRNGQRGGRPPIAIDLETVKRLAAIMASDAEIGQFLGLSARTIARAKKAEAFQLALTQGRALGKLSLRRVLWQSALSGNISMMIFLAKAHLGLSDRGCASSDDPITEIIINVRRPPIVPK